ncbi:dihydroorotase [Candidatus Saganbacteria bacterium]|nr:dihydroorotase [Candidatus Saganbacteria bacterium]
MHVIIKDGTILDARSQKEIKADILIENGKIKEIGKNLKGPANTTIIDAEGLLVSPGLIDMHCHLRDPGDPEDESIESGTRSAALGGFTTIACMPNTNPPLDNSAMIKYITSKSKQVGVVNVLPVGAVTKGLLGRHLTEMGKMIEEGAVAFSDDGMPVSNSQVMRHALEYAKIFGTTIISHSEDLELSAEGQMNEGGLSTILGLKGIPALAEETAIARDIDLASQFGPIHITHVSTAKSVDIIREAKKKGIPVTADTCPHYFSLTENAVEGYNTLAKVNPPLRTQDDVEAIKKGLKDGTIDAIATDHAPHKAEKKNVEFASAAKGSVGFETALSLSLAELKPLLSVNQIIEKLTLAPSIILGIHKGEIKVGADADITIIDPNAEYEINIEAFVSRSKNSPFDKRFVRGKVLHTIVSGRIVVRDGRLVQ